jgi:hypothetical protein
MLRFWLGDPPVVDHYNIRQGLDTRLQGNGIHDDYRHRDEQRREKIEARNIVMRRYSGHQKKEREKQSKHDYLSKYRHWSNSRNFGQILLASYVVGIPDGSEVWRAFHTCAPRRADGATCDAYRLGGVKERGKLRCSLG